VLLKFNEKRRLTAIHGFKRYLVAAPDPERKMPHSILVADDSPVTRETLSRVFKTEPDYDLCAQAVNGREAIDLAIKHRPELIILDLVMPEVNGMEASQQLKEIMPDVPIILFTQYPDLPKALRHGQLPIDCVVSKDDAASLLTHVKSLLQSDE
jgi:DNA-binding NarL/FixJ family response regulator